MPWGRGGEGGFVAMLSVHVCLVGCIDVCHHPALPPQICGCLAQTNGDQWLTQSRFWFSPNNTGVGLGTVLADTLAKIEEAAAATGSCALQQAASTFRLQAFIRPW